MGNPLKPIPPAEAEVAKRESVPDAMIWVFNGLIVKNLRGRQANIDTADIFAALSVEGHDSDEVAKSGWLECISAIYSEAGWVVRLENGAAHDSINDFFGVRKSCRVAHTFFLSKKPALRGLFLFLLERLCKVCPLFNIQVFTSDGEFEVMTREDFFEGSARICLCKGAEELFALAT